MTAILIRAPDGDWLTREHTHSEVLLFMALGYQPQDASERLARFASGQAVRVGKMTWEMR